MSVMLYGGNFWTVGVFSFFGGNDSSGGGKPKYGSNFSAVGGFSLFLR